MSYKKYTKSEAKEEIRNLVEKFRSEFGDKVQKGRTEAQVEDIYIKPFFSFLNWNIHSIGLNKGREEFIVQTTQKRKKKTVKPDYELWVPNRSGEEMKRVLFMEAKDPKYDLSKEIKYIRQAYLYAHSSLSITDNQNKWANLALLTDFEEFRLFDCRDPFPLEKNSLGVFNKYIVAEFDWRFTDYIEKFDLLWETFERDNVYNGSLDKYQVTENELRKRRIAPDERFLDDLRKWRLDFAKSMYKSNKEVSNDFLTAATQLMINRIIFMKMLTDREIEDDYLTMILEDLKKGSEEISIYEACRKTFEKLNKKYNGDIFKKREEFDHVIIENKVFKKVIESLVPEKSLYTLAAMPVEIIGNVYEQFLGEVIVQSKGEVDSEKKPEVQKAGGVYYTPKYIVDYIVENTVGEKLKKCKSPKDAEKIKILDPACGSGSFLLGAYEYLLNWHKDYYEAEIQKMLDNGKNASNIVRKYQNELKYIPLNTGVDKGFIVHLSSKLKKQILLNNIFGVDIDANAVEISKFSLSMKALEGASQEEIGEDIHLFHEQILPSLSDNIKCGNSLISPDIYENILPITDVDSRVKVFDWYNEELGFGKIMNSGKFNCIIGNPPYIFSRELFSEIEKEYFLNKYNTIWEKPNTYMIFMEKGYELLADEGLMSYIVPNSWLTVESGKLLRKFLLVKSAFRIINDLNYYVFEHAKVEPTIFITCKTDVASNKVEARRISSKSDFENKNFVNIEQNTWEKSSITCKMFVSGNPQIDILINRLLESSLPLGKEKGNKGIFDVRTGLQAYETGKGHPKQTKENVKNRIYDYDYKYNNHTYKYIDGINIKRYFSDWSGKYLLHGKWLSQPRNIDMFIRPRILVREITNKPPYCINANLLEETFLNNKSILNILDFSNNINNLKLLLGQMNSSLISFFYKNRAVKSSRKVFPKIVIKDLRKFPLRVNFNISLENNIISLVDDMLELKLRLQTSITISEKDSYENRISYLNGKIDELVYELFELTRSEIEIVEENLKK